MTGNLIHWVWLQDVFGAASTRAVSLVKKYGSPENVFFSDEIPKAPPIIKSRFLKKDLKNAERILEICDKRAYTLLTPSDKNYPHGLSELPDMPLVLYCRGNVPDFNSGIYISSVGKRECSPRGAETAYKICSELSSSGVNIVSGMAAGIDYCSHYGAVNASGFTVAVLGCGVDVLYPPKNEKLRDSIALHGLIMSEYPPGTRPTKFSFPARNRIVACISCGTVVIDAAERSGSLITAEYARLNGKMIFAVPGMNGTLGVGTDKLIEKGAYSVTSGEDIAYILNEKYPGIIDTKRLFMQREINENYPEDIQRIVATAVQTDTHTENGYIKSVKQNLSDGEKAVLECLDTPKTPDEISSHLCSLPDNNIGMGELFCILTDLETYGLITQGAGGRYKII